MIAAKEDPLDGIERRFIRSGVTVDIVLKKDQRSGKLTRGIVRDVLTGSERHPHGIKVRPRDGQVGRVKKILDWGCHHLLLAVWMVRQKAASRPEIVTPVNGVDPGDDSRTDL